MFIKCFRSQLLLQFESFCHEVKVYQGVDHPPTPPTFGGLHCGGVKWKMIPCKTSLGALLSFTGTLFFSLSSPPRLTSVSGRLLSEEVIQAICGGR